MANSSDFLQEGSVWHNPESGTIAKVKRVEPSTRHSGTVYYVRMGDSMQDYIAEVDGFLRAFQPMFSVQDIMAMLDEDHEIASRCVDRALEDGDYNVAGNFQHRAAYIHSLRNRINNA